MIVGGRRGGIGGVAVIVTTTRGPKPLRCNASGVAFRSLRHTLGDSLHPFAAPAEVVLFIVLARSTLSGVTVVVAAAACALSVPTCVRNAVLILPRASRPYLSSPLLTAIASDLCISLLVLRASMCISRLCSLGAFQHGWV